MFHASLFIMKKLWLINGLRDSKHQDTLHLMNSIKTYTADFPFKGKSVFQAPCNNGREILSFINMGASEGVGFDISDENIAFSDKLKNVSGIQAEFILTNVYEIPDTFYN